MTSFYYFRLFQLWRPRLRRLRGTPEPTVNLKNEKTIKVTEKRAKQMTKDKKKRGRKKETYE